MTDNIHSGVDRRDFLKHAGLGVAGVAAGAGLLAACGDSSEQATTETAAPATTAAEAVELASDLPEIEWDMATSWPVSLVTLYGAAQIFSEQLALLTGGKFKITPRPAGEIVGGLDVLPAVRDGGVQSGHTASYYYVGLSPVNQFGTAVPFGLTQRQHNAWLYYGGGLDALNAHYAEEYDIIAFPAGGTGCQMGGWFSKRIDKVSDIKGLKMRIPGISGKVLAALGGEAVNVAAGEILQSIQTGAIDAAEFVGPADDTILGLDQFKGELFYYHPGWWEPGTTLEVEFPLKLWNELPEQYQAAIKAAAAYAHLHTTAKYDAINPPALAKIKEYATVVEFSPSVLAAFKEETEKVLDGLAAGDAKFKTILDSWKTFRAGVAEWHSLAELSYLKQQSA